MTEGVLRITNRLDVLADLSISYGQTSWTRGDGCGPFTVQEQRCLEGKELKERVWDAVPGVSAHSSSLRLWQLNPRSRFQGELAGFQFVT